MATEEQESMMVGKHVSKQRTEWLEQDAEGSSLKHKHEAEHELEVAEAMLPSGGPHHCHTTKTSLSSATN